MKIIPASRREESYLFGLGFFCVAITTAPFSLVSGSGSNIIT